MLVGGEHHSAMARWCEEAAASNAWQTPRHRALQSTTAPMRRGSSDGPMSALAALGVRHQRLSSIQSFDTLHGVVRAEISGELATDDAAPERRLIARTTLAASHGMMFVFAASAPRAFWMKNTRPAGYPVLRRRAQTDVGATRRAAVYGDPRPGPPEHRRSAPHAGTVNRYGTTFRRAAWRPTDDKRSHRRGAARASEPAFRNVGPTSGTGRKARTDNLRRSW